jgi:hypothetical protein
MNDLRNNLETQLEQVKATLALLDKFPDLKEYESRFQRTFLISKIAIPLAEQAELHMTCYCCHAKLEIYPFLTIGKLRVYTDPLAIVVGEKYGRSCTTHVHFQTALAKLGFSPELIRTVRDMAKYFLSEKGEEELEEF